MNKIIEIEFKREDKPILFIKTCAEYESYLKKNGKKGETDNFLNQGLKTTYYSFDYSLFGSSDDRMGRGLFIYGKMNRAILRVKGISKGIKIDLEKCGIISLETMESEIRAILKDFKNFYKNNISKVKIKGSLELNDL